MTISDHEPKRETLSIGVNRSLDEEVLISLPTVIETFNSFDCKPIRFQDTSVFEEDVDHDVVLPHVYCEKFLQQMNCETITPEEHLGNVSDCNENHFYGCQIVNLKNDNDSNGLGSLDPFNTSNISYVNVKPVWKWKENKDSESERPFQSYFAPLGSEKCMEQPCFIGNDKSLTYHENNIELMESENSNHVNCLVSEELQY